MNVTAKTDWYERRDELEQGQVFRLECGAVVKLDVRVPGDGTDWNTAIWCGDHFSYEDFSIHPGDLSERLPDDFAGEGR
jgi:hypothetical protein